jgi:hypothetical protein
MSGQAGKAGQAGHALRKHSVGHAWSGMHGRAGRHGWAGSSRAGHTGGWAGRGGTWSMRLSTTTPVGTSRKMAARSACGQWRSRCERG